MNVDAKELKEKLTTKQIIEIVESLGGEMVRGSENINECIFSSICHNIDANDPSHKPKLYYYKNNNMFKCYVCGFSGDIYSLIEERWNLEDKDYEFKDVMNYVLKTLHLENSLHIYFNKKSKWKDDLKKLFIKKNTSKPYKIYDLSVLDLFDEIYHIEWIKDGISVESMKKFHIGYYSLLDCTTIPVFDDVNNIIGIHGRFWRKEDIEEGKYRPVHTLNENFKFPTSEVLYGLNINKENISNTRTVFLFEAPKSVLQMENILDKNNSVALFGCNMSISQRNLLLKYGVENWIICLDKQYKKIFNINQEEQNEDLTEYRRWVEHVRKIQELLKGFGNVYVVYDKNNLLEYKDSPSDKGKEIFNKLLDGKKRI